MVLARGLFVMALSFLTSAAFADLTAQDITNAETFYRQGERSSPNYPADRFIGIAETQMRKFAELSQAGTVSEDLQLAALSALQFYAIEATTREVLAMVKHHEGYQYKGETVEWDLHYYALIENDPLGGENLSRPSYAFQLLNLILKNPSSESVSNRAAWVEDRFLELLVKIALDQGEFSQISGTQTRNIKAAIDLLDVLNTKKSIKALLTVAQGTPGRAEPLREFQLTMPRQNLANYYAVRALGLKAQSHSPQVYAAACGKILLGE